MSSNYTRYEVAIRCRVRITSVAISSPVDGENREMICTMLHGENLHSTHCDNLDETYGVDISKNESTFVESCIKQDENQENSSNNTLSQNIETLPMKKKVGPRLTFRPVPKPPSRPESQFLFSKEEVKSPIHVDQVSPVPVYYGISGKVNPLEVQTSSKLRGVQSTSPGSVRAAAMFAVKKGTETDLVEDDETYAISMDHVAAVNLKPSSTEGRQSDTDLIHIITIYGGVLQLSFYYRHEQDLLLGFLQAFLSPSTIKIQTCTESSTPCIDRSESNVTMDMEKLQAREMKVRILNEGFWEKITRRTARWLSRTEEICCLCDSDNNTNKCKNSPDEGSNTIITELEIDNGGEVALSSSFDSRISVAPDRIGNPNISQSIVEEAIDDRDDSIREDRYKT